VEVGGISRVEADLSPGSTSRRGGGDVPVVVTLARIGSEQAARVAGVM